MGNKAFKLLIFQTRMPVNTCRPCQLIFFTFESLFFKIFCFFSNSFFYWNQSYSKFSEFSTVNFICWPPNMKALKRKTKRHANSLVSVSAEPDGATNYAINYSQCECALSVYAKEGEKRFIVWLEFLLVSVECLPMFFTKTLNPQHLACAKTRSQLTHLLKEISSISINE